MALLKKAFPCVGSATEGISPQGGSATQLVLSGDDFGASSTVNAAIIQAHREGLLTSASLMVAGDAVDEAVALARETPTLSVGLHLVVIDGCSLLPPSEIPHLVDSRRRFVGGPLSLGLRYAFNPRARKELAAEIEAQLAWYAATGLSLSHVDSHLHMHLHPAVLHILLPWAARYGAKGIRIPRDELRPALAYNRRRLGTKLFWALAFSLLARYSLGCITSYGLVVSDRVYGLYQSGDMAEDYVLGVLRALDVPTAEIYFHPDLQAQSTKYGPTRDDLCTLLSLAVAQVVRERGFRLTTYPELGRDWQDD